VRHLTVTWVHALSASPASPVLMATWYGSSVPTSSSVQLLQLLLSPTASSADADCLPVIIGRYDGLK